MTGLELVFIILVSFMLVLAGIDLFVGVSNDAVNFLNSAVGCRIAPLQTILIVASLGVLLGATFSSGMMEVARSGVFHPDRFSFYEVMLIFFAVMVTDVLLLNLFNSLGLPTSTTVSIIFELLGAAVCAAAYKLNELGLSYSEIFEYIKSDRAVTIVSAILVSVAVAFVSGAVVQFVLRLLFSFRFQNTYRYLGGIFCGFSLTSIIYFLVMKGAKGASFMKPEYIDFINQNTLNILWTLFIVLSVIGQVLVFLKFNVFKIIILSGTFALAFSFAGNDLVNFIGVPLAALESFMNWYNSGADVYTLGMDSLNQNNQTPTIFLVIAGFVMVLTLWFSKKAHRVIQTSINLSSSSHGEHEQFGASTLGRVVTRFGLGVSRTTIKVMPKFMLAFVAGRYQKVPVVKGQTPLPFDYVRASVNLVLASILIASATSLKLPLSTTYVTFMVAMGSSFADGAWDRESAVYRISGVITVIAGWFLTGLSAFTAAFIVALLYFSFSFTAIFLTLALSLVVIFKTNFMKQKTSETVASVIEAKNDNKKILASVSKAVPVYFDLEVEVVDRALSNFFSDNEFKLRKAFNKASNIEYEISKERAQYYTLALDQSAKQDANGITVDAKHFFYLTFSNMREASKSIRYMVERAVIHVANRHTIFEGNMKTNLLDLLARLRIISEDMHTVANSPTFDNVEAIVKHTKKLNRDIDRAQVYLVNIIGRQHVSMHSAEMYLGFLQGIRDLANRYVAVAMQERALSQIVAGVSVDSEVDNAQMRSTVLGTAIRTNNEELVCGEEDSERDNLAHVSSVSNPNEQVTTVSATDANAPTNDLVIKQTDKSKDNVAKEQNSDEEQPITVCCVKEQ